MIDVINLKKSFGETEVLKDISVTINKGDIVVVLGPSGSGKSTFLRCLNCMEDPTGGSIIFNGVDIADIKVDINIHRRHMGMVFQHFNLFNNKTVIQNIMLAPVYVKCQELRKNKRKNAKIRIKNLFSKQKEELIPITTSKAEIQKEADEYFDKFLTSSDELFKENYLNAAMSKYYVLTKIDYSQIKPYIQLARIYDEKKSKSGETETVYSCTKNM